MTHTLECGVVWYTHWNVWRGVVYTEYMMWCGTHTGVCGVVWYTLECVVRCGTHTGVCGEVWCGTHTGVCGVVCYTHWMGVHALSEAAARTMLQLLYTNECPTVRNIFLDIEKTSMKTNASLHTTSSGSGKAH